MGDISPPAGQRLPDRASSGQGQRWEPSRRRRRHPSRQPKKKARPQPRWADLSNLFDEADDDPRFGALKKQAVADLWCCVDVAEKRLDWLIRSGFRLLEGGRR